MRKTFYLIAAAGFAATSAHASGVPINDQVKLKQLDRAFEMAAAELKTVTVIYEDQCPDEKPASCSFHGQGQLQILGAADSIDSAPTSITLIYTPDGDPNPFVLNVGLLVSVAEPGMPQDDRAKIITSIVRIAGGQEKGPIVEGRNAAFSVTDILGSIWVVAEKAAN